VACINLSSALTTGGKEGAIEPNSSAGGCGRDSCGRAGTNTFGFGFGFVGGPAELVGTSKGVAVADEAAKGLLDAKVKAFLVDAPAEGQAGAVVTAGALARGSVGLSRGVTIPDDCVTGWATFVGGAGKAGAQAERVDGVLLAGGATCTLARREGVGRAWTGAGWHFLPSITS
jgi:hypothetical protein